MDARGFTKPKVLDMLNVKYLITNKKIKELDENEYMKIFHQLYDLLEKNHYENYEISNWAKTSFESIHNLLTIV